MKKIFLVCASYFFYITLDSRFVFLIILSPIINYSLGLTIKLFKDKKIIAKSVLIFGIIFNLSLLAFFKYSDFILQQTKIIFHFLNFSWDPPLFDWALPLGISFFTFQGISYLVDIYKGKIFLHHTLLDVLLLVAFFPHLVSGPIVRGSDFLPQLQQANSEREIKLFKGLLLICFGLFKKIVIANYLATDLVDPVFDNVTEYSALETLWAVYGYSIQIYCDFSGYSDLAIGLAALLGYDFPDNFNQPYRSQSLQDFWKRWHISLSTWLREYLYIPLGGSLHGEFKTYRNLIITMILGGLWHGASWTFIIWGFIHGSFLVFERTFRKKYPQCFCLNSQIINTIITFHIVTLAWIFFRSPSFEQASQVLQQIFTLKNLNIIHLTHWHFILVAIGVVINFVPVQWINVLEVKFEEAPILIPVLTFSMLLLMISALYPEGIAPFIYFRF